MDKGVALENPEMGEGLVPTVQEPKLRQLIRRDIGDEVDTGTLEVRPPRAELVF